MKKTINLKEVNMNNEDSQFDAGGLKSDIERIEELEEMMCHTFLCVRSLYENTKKNPLFGSLDLTSDIRITEPLKRLDEYFGNFELEKTFRLKQL